MNPAFPLHQFLAWARTKPADERYSIYYPETCALGQFASETGYDHALCGDPDVFGIPGLKDAIGWFTDGQTWGTLVKRLEVLVPAPAELVMA